MPDRAETRNEFRLYAIVDAMNCKGWENLSDMPGAVMLRNIGQIKNAGSRFVFLDDGGTGGATLGGWTCHIQEEKWWDPPPLRHGDGTTFSFADGHCEHRKWKDRRTVKFGEKETSNSPEQPGNEDIRWSSYGCWGSAAGR